MSELDESRELSLTLTVADWRLIQEGMDVLFYETEHWTPGGFTRSRQARSRARRAETLERLQQLDRTIGAATGLGGVFT